MKFITVFLKRSNLFSNALFYKYSQNDWSDKLSWSVTVNILILLLFIVSNVKNFINKSISCAVPIYFSSNQEQYVNEICFISDKYYAMDNQRIIIYDIKQTSNKTKLSDDFNANNIDIIDEKRPGEPILIAYYIWVPYFLILQILLILLPRKLWFFFLNRLTNLDIIEFFKAAKACKNITNTKMPLEEGRLYKAENFKYLVDYLERFIDFNLNAIYNQNFKTLTSILSKLNKCKLFLAYLLVKMLNLVNFFIQIYMIKTLLGFKINLIELFETHHFLTRTSETYEYTNETNNIESDWQSPYIINSHYFPFNSICTFKIKELGFTNSYAVMCTLPINLFNHYVFVLLLVWYFWLIVINGFYLLLWLSRFSSSSQMSYITKKLATSLRHFSKRKRIRFDCNYLCHIANETDRIEERQLQCVACTEALEKFQIKYFSTDFVFLMQIISINANENITELLLLHLWRKSHLIKN
jgi:innexin